MNFRIKKHTGGFVVEIQKPKRFLFITKTYWTHFISVAGIDNLPWYYSTKNFAMEGLLFKIKCETIENSN